jgi:crotonobetainyl-CoA:carnitine CoA-transferase CaiB-like acyl-CoA transferase
LKGAIEGVRVLDLTSYLSGPYCTMLLGDLGAEVVKVEEPGKGDGSRAWGPPFVGGESTYFMSINRNKKSVTLNLKTEDGRRALLRLAERADVVVENYRVGVVKKLGIDYEAVKGVNPSIIYCSISGFGQDGPHSQKPAYDLVAQAMGGVMGLTGYEDGPPVKVGIAMADLTAGMFAAVGILAALHRRDRTGTGQFIDVAMLDGQVSLLTFVAGAYLATGEVPKRLGTAHPSIAPYQAFRAGDGSYFVLAVGTDKMFADFCEAVGLDLASDSRFSTNSERVKNRAELVRILEGHFASKPASHWLSVIERAGVPCAPINTLDRVFSDPQVAHRRMVREVDHPKAGRVKLLGPPIRMSESDPEIRAPPPTLGQHTEEMLLSVGYSKEEILRLREKGVV